MEPKIRDSILKEYDIKHSSYASFTDKVKHLLAEVLEANKMRVHSITERVKERDSLRGKIERSETTYNKLSDITDIAGIRIITFYSDDVDKVADIVRREFKVDDLLSVDKRAKMDPDRFGYMSLHYIVAFDSERAGLTEYKALCDFKAEIQIRSILQHTWAEIEHDLGYKTKDGIPRDTRRQFSRLAGLLELADEEFLDIREELNTYRKQLVKEIATNLEKVPIDRDSLSSFIQSNSLVRKIDSRLNSGRDVGLDEPYDKSSEMMVSRLKDLGFGYLGQVEHGLNLHSDTIVAFGLKWLSGNKDRVPKGISVFYLCYVLMARQFSREQMIAHINQYFKHPNVEAFVTRIISTSKELNLDRKQFID